MAKKGELTENENSIDLSKYTKRGVEILHSLGLFQGTVLWMEEIVNRFYFSTINSFVYFGAAILLVIIGVRRFTDQIDNNIVIAGIAFEALMLVFIFIVMLFSPHDTEPDDEENGDEADELITEIGELGRDFAAVVIQLENLGNSMVDVISRQNEILNAVDKIVEANTNATQPNPKMLEVMDKTNKSIEEFGETLKQLNSTAEMLKKEEIEMAVRREVERIIVDKVNKP